MKKNHVFALLILCIILVMTFFYMKKEEMKHIQGSETGIGTPVFNDLDLDKISSIKIFSGDQEKVTMLKNNDVWTVANLYDYPADPSKLRSLTLDVATMKNMKSLQAAKSQLDRLGLDSDSVNTPPTKAEFGSKDAKIAEFLAGKMHTRKSDDDPMMEISDGRFILRSETKDPLLADKTLSELDLQATDWLDKTFLSSGKLKKASLSNGVKTIWELKRDDIKQDMKLDPLPKNSEVDSSKTGAISSALEQMGFIEIADPGTKTEESGLDKPKIFCAEDFDGITYRLKIGAKKANAYYVKVEAEYKESPLSKDKENDKPEESEKIEEEHAEKQKSSRMKVEEISKKYSPWIYMISENKINPIIAEYEELLKKKDDGPNKNQTTTQNKNLN